MTFNDYIYNEDLTKIKKNVKISRKKLQDFGMMNPQRELNYNVTELQQQATEIVPWLLTEQRRVFEEVLRHIESGSGALFFLDAPGGTGKTFLLNLLFAYIRKIQALL